MGLGYYRIVEDEDGKLCETCAKMNGKVFAFEDYEQGVTAPPFHENCRGKVEELAGGASIVKQGRDEENGWVDEAISEFFGQLGNKDISFGALLGMKHDKEAGIIYHSKNGGPQLQTKIGYTSWFDMLSMTIFDLDAPVTRGEVAYRDENGNGSVMSITHRVWAGDYSRYLGIGLLFILGMMDKRFSLTSTYGCESSILINDKYLDDHEFVQKIELYNEDWDKVLEFDSAEMYNDLTADWVFACMPTGMSPKYVMGTLKHENEEYIRALMGADGSKIRYGIPYIDEDGLFCVRWMYAVGDWQI